MNKKTILIGIISLVSICGCTNKSKDGTHSDSAGARNDLVGAREGYEYARGIKCFDTYLGDEIPTSIDYPGFENTFTYHPEDKYFTINGIENSDEYKITTQLYFSDVNNDGYKEIIISNNRFYKPDPENPDRKLNTNLDPFGAWVIDLHGGCLVISGMGGASVEHYYRFSVDEKGELVESRYFKDREKPFIVNAKYFYATGDYLYNGILEGCEEVGRVNIEE